MINSNGMELDEETLDAMLGMSTIPEERDELKKQLRLSEMLTRGGIDYNPYLGRGTGTKANVGGALGALSQGLQGYAGGKLYKEGQTADLGLRQRERQGREKWFRARYGNQGGGGGAGAATPIAMFDPGQPETRVLPPDDEYLIP
jgi:hypothetical protein